MRQPTPKASDPFEQVQETCILAPAKEMARDSPPEDKASADPAQAVGDGVRAPAAPAVDAGRSAPQPPSMRGVSPAPEKNGMPEPFVSQTKQPAAADLCYTEA